MSTNDGINAIEDEPYEGVYRGAVSAYAAARDHLPDRFDLADILRSTRDARGWSLDQVAEMTRVRRAYLEALEQAAYDVLPPRAFAIGYVKAYAKALGLDEETLADMFKRDVTEPQARLQAPSGASLEDVKPNYRLYITAATCLVLAVVVWNVLQHKPIDFNARGHKGTPLTNESWSLGQPLIRDGVVYVTKAAPAPKDQDIPAPYATPGLEDQFASIAAEKNKDETVQALPAQDVLQARKAFNPRGAVYGAQPEASSVTLQAVKGASLILHDSANQVYFVHQFAAGEAYRVPQADQQNLLIDLSDITAFEVYYNGEYAGTMDALSTPVARANARAAQMSAALDARQAAQGQVSTVYRQPAPALERPTLAPRNTAPIPYMPAKPVVKPATPQAKAPVASTAANTTGSHAASSSAAAPVTPPAEEPAQ